MRVPRTALRACILACALGPAAVAMAQDEGVGSPLRAAQMWLSKGRADIARQLALKALAQQPDGPQALAFVADLDLREGQPEAARKTLQLLQQAHPANPATLALAELVRVYGSDREKLARMRLMSRAGRKAEAAAVAKELFPNGPPTLGGLDVEYYETIAGRSPQAAADAVAALANLYRSTGDSRYRLAELGMRMRTAKAESLVSQIEQLVAAPDVNQRQAMELWRRAINALDDVPSNAATVRSYLRLAPPDPALRERLAAMQVGAERPRVVAQPAETATAKTGGRSRPAAEEPVSESTWETRVARRPDDTAALGALAAIRLRQGRFSDARDLFARAADAAPAEPAWRARRDDAEMQTLLRGADLALESGNVALAASQLERALVVRPQDAEALAALAGVRAMQNRSAEAEALYRQALAANPRGGDALRGLAALLGRTGRAGEGLALLDAGAQPAPADARRITSIRVDLMKEQADAMAAAGRVGPALRVLEAALLLAPEDPWLRHSLARLYLKLQLPTEARGLMDEGVALKPADTEMRYARALIRSAGDDYDGALTDLAAIEPAQYSPGMRSLARRSQVQQLVARATGGDARFGSPAVLVAEAERVAEDDPDLVYAVANAWFKLGQPGQGVAAYSRTVSRTPEPTSEMLLDRARLVDRAADDRTLAGLIPPLLLRVDWTAEQETRLLALYASHRERLIDKARASGKTDEALALARAGLPAGIAGGAGPSDAARGRLLLAAGDFPAAAAALETARATSPDSTEVRLDLANALAQSGRAREARVEAEQLDKLIPREDVGRRLALLRLWQRSGDTDRARAEAQRLLAASPGDSDVVLHAARLERGAAHYADAVALYRRALTIESAGPPAPALPVERRDVSGPDMEPALALRMAYRLGTVREAGMVAVAGMGSLPDNPPGPGPWADRVQDAMALRASTWPARFGEDGGDSDGGGLPPADDPRRRIAADIAAIESRRQALVEAGYQSLRKSATDGISSLRGSELPVAIWWPGDMDYDGRYFLRLDRVRLDAGPLPAAADDASQFGQVAAWPPEAYRPGDYRQARRAYNIGLGYAGERLRWDIGRTGNGFPVSNVVGGYVRSGELGAVRYEWGVLRRPLTGSVLSYAGAQDPVTGQTWGGVVATGAGGRVATDAGPYSLSASANAARLTGRNVADNTRLQTRLAADRDVMRGGFGVLNLGVSLSAWRFAHDLSQYTWGHGGYYSPHSYQSLAFPLEWSGEQGRLAWLVRGSVSVSRSSSQASDFYPGNPTLQGQAALLSASGNELPAFAGGGSSGTGRSLRAVVEYRPAGRLAIGAQLEIDRAAYYAPTSVLFYTRFLLDPVSAPLSGRPRPVQPYSQF